MTYTPVYTAYPPPVPVPEPPLRPRRGWWFLLVTSVITAAVMMSVGMIVGSLLRPESAPEPAQPAAPVARPFAAADKAWCDEYLDTSRRLEDAGRAAGAPRTLAAADQPATTWDLDDAAGNAKFADHLTTWSTGMAHLRATAEHPVLKALIFTDLDAYTALAKTIRDGTYVPANGNEFLSTIGAAESGLKYTCEELES